MRSTGPPAILLSTVLAFACGGGSPSAPSSTIPVGEAPAPAPDVSRLGGTWNLMVRVIAVAGTGCVAETMRLRMGAPEPYTLSVAQNPHKTTVTLKSASGAYACTFAPSADAAGLSTYGRPGYYTCEPFTMEFRCSDGTLHTIFTMGQDIAVRLSGDGVSGEWDAAWFEAEDWVGTEMKAQFTGGR